MSIFSDLGHSQKNPSGQTIVGQMAALDKSDHSASDDAVAAQNGADKAAADDAVTAQEEKRGSGTLPIPSGFEKEEKSDEGEAVSVEAGPALVPLDAELKQDAAKDVLDLSVLDDPPNAAKGWDPVPPSATIIAGKIPIGDEADGEADAKEQKEQKDAPAEEKEEEHYEVHVQHYANYDKTDDSGYGEQVQKNLKYASKTPWARFIVDFTTVMVRPIHFWEEQAEHPATLGQVHFPHLVVLVLLRAVSIFVGNVFLDGTDKLHQLVSVVAQALLIFVFVWLLALIYSAIMAVVSKGFHFSKCLNFVAYAVTPLLVIQVLSVFPIPYMNTICDIIALPYVFVVLGAGMLPFLKVPEKTAPVLCGLFCGLMACLWSVLPILMPSLIHWNSP